MDPNIRDKMGFSASYWAKENGHPEVVSVLPPPLAISIEEFYEHKMQMKKALKLKSVGKKKGKKGKKGKKKK